MNLDRTDEVVVCLRPTHFSGQREVLVPYCHTGRSTPCLVVRVSLIRWTDRCKSVLHKRPEIDPYSLMSESEKSLPHSFVIRVYSQFTHHPLHKPHLCRVIEYVPKGPTTKLSAVSRHSYSILLFYNTY